jgi:hypothetical protein
MGRRPSIGLLIVGVVLDVALTMALAILWRVVRGGEYLKGGSAPQPSAVPAGATITGLAAVACVWLAVLAIGALDWSPRWCAAVLLSGPLAVTLSIFASLWFTHAAGPISGSYVVHVILPGIAEFDPPWPWLVMWLPGVVGALTALALGGLWGSRTVSNKRIEPTP